MALNGRTSYFVDWMDVAAYDETLAHAILNRPEIVLPLLETAVRYKLRNIHPVYEESLTRLYIRFCFVD